MDLNKISKKISLPKELWQLVRDCVKTIGKVEDIVNNHLYNGFDKRTTTKMDGAIATKTMINPLLTKQKDHLHLDIALEFEIENRNLTSKVAQDIKVEVINAMNKLFNNKVKFIEKDKIIEFEVEANSKGHKVLLDFDFLLIGTRNGVREKVDLHNNSVIISDPISLIDHFNGKNSGWEMKYGSNFSPRTLLKVIKALQYIEVKENVIPYSLMMNQILLAYKGTTLINWKNIIEQFEEGINSFHKDNHINNTANLNVEIEKPKNFNYEKSLNFLSKIKNLKKDEIMQMIEKALK